MKHEYLIIYVGKYGFGRLTLTLDSAITDIQTLSEIDNLIREQENNNGEKDDTAFVINYKLLKAYNI